VETSLANLAKQVEKNAYELTGQPPVAVLGVDALAALVGAALEEALRITRTKAVTQEAMQVGRMA
jgi:hypothetical protein